MKKILIFALFAFMLSGCAYKNANVSTTVDNAIATIDAVIKDKPECKSVGDICKKQIDAVNSICNTEIKNERDRSWNSGFKTGAISLFVLIVGIWLLKKRFIK